MLFWLELRDERPLSLNAGASTVTFHPMPLLNQLEEPSVPVVSPYSALEMENEMDHLSNRSLASYKELLIQQKHDTDQTLEDAIEGNLSSSADVLVLQNNLYTTRKKSKRQTSNQLKFEIRNKKIKIIFSKDNNEESWRKKENSKHITWKSGRDIKNIKAKDEIIYRSPISTVLLQEAKKQLRQAQTTAKVTPIIMNETSNRLLSPLMRERRSDGGPSGWHKDGETYRSRDGNYIAGTTPWSPLRIDAFEVDKELEIEIPSDRLERSSLLKQLEPLKHNVFYSSGSPKKTPIYDRHIHAPFCPQPQLINRTCDSLTVLCCPPPDSIERTQASNVMETQLQIFGQSGEWERHYSLGLQTAIIIDGLEADKLFRIRCRARNSVGWGLWSEMLEVDTEKAILPEAPDKPWLSSEPTSNTARVEWSAPHTVGRCIMEYEVRVIRTHRDLDLMKINTNVINRLNSRSGHLEQHARRKVIAARIGNPRDAFTKFGAWVEARRIVKDSYQSEAPACLGINGYIISTSVCEAFVIKDLSPASHYAVSVRARIQEGYSDWSEALLIYTPPTDISQEPLNVKVIKKFQTAFRLRWNPPAYDGCKKITAYRIQASDNGFNWKTTNIIENNEDLDVIEGEIDNLNAGHHYFLRVTARNAYGWGKSSNSIDEYTLGTKPPHRVSPPEVMNVTQTRIWLKLSPPKTSSNDFEIIKSYIIQLSRDPHDWEKAITVRSNEAESGVNVIVAGDLTPDTVYYVRGRCSNCVGLGPWSKPRLTVQTLPFHVGDRVMVWWDGPWVRQSSWWKGTITKLIYNDRSHEFGVFHKVPIYNIQTDDYPKSKCVAGIPHVKELLNEEPKKAVEKLLESINFHLPISPAPADEDSKELLIENKQNSIHRQNRYKSRFPTPSSFRLSMKKISK